MLIAGIPRVRQFNACGKWICMLHYPFSPMLFKPYSLLILMLESLKTKGVKSIVPPILSIFLDCTLNNIYMLNGNIYVTILGQLGQLGIHGTRYI